MHGRRAPLAIRARPLYTQPVRQRTPRSLRLAVQDVALSRRKQGFDSPRERQNIIIISNT